MAFSVYEIVRVACLSRSWFAYAQLRDKQVTRMTSYTLKAMQKNLCSYCNVASHDADILTF